MVRHVSVSVWFGDPDCVRVPVRVTVCGGFTLGKCSKFPQTWSLIRMFLQVYSLKLKSFLLELKPVSQSNCPHCERHQDQQPQ